MENDNDGDCNCTFLFARPIVLRDSHLKLLPWKYLMQALSPAGRIEWELIWGFWYRIKVKVRRNRRLVSSNGGYHTKVVQEPMLCAHAQWSVGFTHTFEKDEFLQNWIGYALAPFGRAFFRFHLKFVLLCFIIDDWFITEFNVSFQ